MSNLLVDIDGTICEDVPNEESYRYADAKVYDGAAEQLKELIADGNTLTYFTAREEKDRQVTILWLKKHGFPEARLLMDKPRGGQYCWIDNHKVRGVRYYKGVNSERWNAAFANHIRKIIKDVASYG